MANTVLKFLEDSYVFEDTATLQAAVAYENGKPALILDQTIMYAQGGGQPYDLGTISQNGNIFNVTEVRYKGGIIYHIGEIISGSLEPKKAVVIQINEPRRRLHARLHTAGHLVDDAMFALDYKLKPLKGYHFPDGPYVEYEGELDGDLVTIAADVERKLNEIIQTDYHVHSEIVPTLADLEGKCLYIPDYIPAGKPIRLIYASSPTKGQPCGGTHVKNLAEIGYVTIPKIKIKGGTTRVSYNLK